MEIKSKKREGKREERVKKGKKILREDRKESGSVRRVRRGVKAG